jgi:glutamate 5-kinase
MNREHIKTSRRWVVKIGSSLLTADGKGLDGGSMTTWVDQMANHLEQGIELLIVSSGAVAEGMSRMGWSKRPGQLHELQAAAAIGQMGLIKAWESCFQRRGLLTAQVLLTHDDLTNRSRYLNARSTLKTLLKLGVVPVINENDTVANDELRFGDNDTLAALVANLVEADLLILLTDQQGLYDADPRFNAAARQLTEARADDPMLEQVAGDSGSGLGRGGMLTKVRAAKLAARSGTSTLIAGGREPLVLARIGAGEPLGTLILPTHGPDAARKRWLAGHLQVRGRLVLDAGATRALREQGKSLLAVGVRCVEGSFVRGEVVSCVDESGRELARGLVNYSATEAAKIAGTSSSAILDLLGYVNEEELIHRSNLVLV